ncbi:amidohydrolase [Thermoproteota archaeon]
MVRCKINSWIDEHKEYLIELSDSIWEYAEVGLMEYKSATLLSNELEKHGFNVCREVSGMPTAFTATWGKGTPVIGITGEYDALAGISQKKIPYKEPLVQGAPGHGCGHNIHGVTGLAAAMALRHTLIAENLQGTLKFFGTPAEESYDAKVFMVRDGLFDDLDACFSHHPGNMNTAKLDSSNSEDIMKFHFFGKTSHAASSPEHGRSALDAIELMNAGVNYLREHVIDKARMHYVIEDGGDQPNVVPDYARSWYWLRAPEREQLKDIYDRVLKIAEGAALMTDTRFKMEYIVGAYNLIPNMALSEIVLSNMREINAPKYSEDELQFAKKIGESISKKQKSTSLNTSKIPNWEKYVDVDLVDDIINPWREVVNAGGTDLADVSWKTPTMEFSTTTFVLGTPGHSWQNVACSGSSIGHKSLIFASKVLAASALDLFTNSVLLKKVKDEHIKRLRGRTYISPLPQETKPPLEMARISAEKSKTK